MSAARKLRDIFGDAMRAKLAGKSGILRTGAPPDAGALSGRPSPAPDTDEAAAEAAIPPGGVGGGAPVAGGSAGGGGGSQELSEAVRRAVLGG